MAGKKVVRYRRKPKAAAIIFGIVLVYIVCFIVIYVSKAKVQTYEVEVGSLMNNASFTAVALRQEEVYNSSYSGDINYYQREGTRVMTGDTVYTVDDPGRGIWHLCGEGAWGGTRQLFQCGDAGHQL